MRKLSVLLALLLGVALFTGSSAQAGCGSCCPNKQEAKCPKEADGEKQCPKADQDKEGCPKQGEQAGAEKAEAQPE